MMEGKKTNLYRTELNSIQLPGHKNCNHKVIAHAPIIKFHILNSHMPKQTKGDRT